MGKKIGDDLKAVRLAVKNRRMKVEASNDEFKPVYKDKLWKVKAQGYEMNEEDWLLREIGLLRMAPSCIIIKEDMDLVYYTRQDLSCATFTCIPHGKTCKNFAFSIQLLP